jgi:hypothetical protein
MGCGVYVKGLEAPSKVKEAWEAFHNEQDYAIQDELWKELQDIEAECLSTFGPWELNMPYSTWMTFCEMVNFELSEEDSKNSCWTNLSIHRMLDCLKLWGGVLWTQEVKWSHIANTLEEILKQGLALGETEFYVV